MITAARPYETDSPSVYLPHLAHPAITDGLLDPVDSKNLTPNALLFANRRVETMERPLHSLGHKFIIDRSGETLAPSDTNFNRPPTSAQLAGLARPEQPTRMFGM